MLASNSVIRQASSKILLTAFAIRSVSRRNPGASSDNASSQCERHAPAHGGIALLTLGRSDGEALGCSGGDAKSSHGDGGAGDVALGRGQRDALRDDAGRHSCGARHCDDETEHGRR